ncbi:TMV resistance protein N [Capsicum chinense]|nr:TMV resistance protein N [Capsicum chinense]
MSQASSSKTFKYDVFLSFRGKDTCRTFVSHLYNALEQKGIRTFKDDERPETGKSISDKLLKAIEEARFAVVIFSRSYASSRWCLEELVHIVKCKNELEQIVIPVFYDVSPSDVHHQNPPFAKSFSKHQKKYRDDIEKVQRWRDAFAEAGKISGYHLQNFKPSQESVSFYLIWAMYSGHSKLRLYFDGKGSGVRPQQQDRLRAPLPISQNLLLTAIVVRHGGYTDVTIGASR